MADTNEPEVSSDNANTTNTVGESTAAPIASKSITNTAFSTKMPQTKKRKKSNVQETPVRISAAPQTPVALPPPLMPYPHPHLVPSYYPVYQHPYYLAVGQPPISPSLSPTLSSSTSTTVTAANTKTTTNARILPKSPTSIAQPANHLSAPPSVLQPSYIYPYAIQVSPQLHPSTTAPPPASGHLSPVAFHPTGVPVRHNSLTSTADEREQARKVSHSAIERRRREKINDKIVQLRDLIPACSERDNLHKMTILQSAIDYIVYLEKVIGDLGGDTNKDKFAPPQIKSALPKEVEPFTHLFSLKDNEEECTPSSTLKPMDVIQLNKRKKTSLSPPPEVAIASPNTNNNADRNMNLENILC